MMGDLDDCIKFTKEFGTKEMYVIRID